MAAANNFDPADKSLTIGHPQIGQVNLKKTFGTTVTDEIWKQLTARLNVRSITTGTHTATYNYSWADADYKERQIASLWP